MVSVSSSPLNHPAWLPLAVVGALAMLTTWLGDLAQAPVVVDEGGFEHKPDYVVERFKATAYDQRGRPRYHLSADTMTHYMDDGTTVLLQPRLVSQEPGFPALRVRAERGQMSRDGQHVHLIDRVEVNQEASGGLPPSVLTTEYLDVMPDARTLRTDRPVRMVRGNDVVTAGNLFAEENARRIKLGGGVRGVYERQH